MKTAGARFMIPKFQHSLMNLGVETAEMWFHSASHVCFSIL